MRDPGPHDMGDDIFRVGIVCLQNRERQVPGIADFSMQQRPGHVAENGRCRHEPRLAPARTPSRRSSLR